MGVVVNLGVDNTSQDGPLRSVLSCTTPGSGGHRVHRVHVQVDEKSSHVISVLWWPAGEKEPKRVYPSSRLRLRPTECVITTPG